MVIQVRCPNLACGQTSRLSDDGLNRVFRCPGCRTKLPFAGSLALTQTTEASRRVTRTRQEVPSVGLSGGDSSPPEWQGTILEAPEAVDSEQTFRLGRLQLRD